MDNDSTNAQYRSPQNNSNPYAPTTAPNQIAVTNQNPEADLSNHAMDPFKNFDLSLQQVDPEILANIDPNEPIDEPIPEESDPEDDDTIPIIENDTVQNTFDQNQKLNIIKAEKNPAQHKNILIISGSVIAGLTLIFTTFFAVSTQATLDNIANGSGNIVDSSGNELETGDDVESASTTSELILGKLISKQDSIKSQSINAVINEQIDLNDGLTYKVLGVDRNFETPTKLRVAEGNELIRINLAVGSRSSSGSVYISSNTFQLRNSSGELRVAKFVGPTDNPDDIRNKTISSGQQISGSVLFEISQDEDIQNLVTNSKYRNINTKEEAVIESEVSL